MFTNRNSNKITRKIISVVLMLVLLLSLLCGMPASAEETVKTVVRIGYMDDYIGFINENEDGIYTGYGADYLTEIAKYTGYQYEYIAGTWTELTAKLQKHEIDFICTAQKNAEREKEFLFSAYPIGYTRGLLYASSGSDICYEDFDALNGVKIGELTDSAINALFGEYADKNGFGYTVTEYETETQMLEALAKGEVTAICSEHLANHNNLSLVADFGADAYYIMTYKGNRYLDDVNYALQQIKSNVDFEAILYHKYYDSSAAENKLQLTMDERNYIANSGTLKVGLMQNRSPLSYADENGKPAGMIVDLMKHVSEMTGLKFEYEFLDIAQKGFDYLSNGGDLVAGVSTSVFSALNPALIESDSLLSSSVVFVGRKGMYFSEDAKLTVALPAGFINGEKVVSAQYPDFKFYNGTSNQNCLQAIRDGNADVMLQNMYVIRECLQSPLYEELAIFPAYTFDESEKVVAMPEDTLLMSVLNKGIALITAKDTNDIVIKHTIAKNYHAQISELAYKYRFPLIGIGILIFAIILLLIAIIIIRQRSFKAAEKANLALEQSNANLSEAVAQAEHANAAKSQFLSRMSHEIRTPINAIVGLTTIAKTHEGDAAKTDDYLTKIETSSKVLLNIINDVLDMSAIESNKLKIAHDRFDIKSILIGISTIYYPQCESKGIEFTMNVNLQHEFFCGDSLRISQILLNLVSNAYKFTAKGGEIRVTVSETANRNGTAFLRFSVSDTGVGMDADMKQRLFKPFEQESATTAQKHGGSGLGLSIAKNLVDMMKGAISVESEKGKGTRFSVDIPLKIADGETERTSDKLKNLRILVADDDKTSLEYTSIVLKRIGVPFETVSTGAEALERFTLAESSEHPYTVVMLDWKMPDMNGIELTQRIREKEQKITTIVIISGYDLPDVEDEARAAGADHFVPKPLFQSTVFNVLMTLSDGELHHDTAKPDEYDFTGHKVLLVEDIELNAEIETELLNMVNLPCDLAADGQIAVEMFRNAAPETYDAILMDIQMPNMNGYEATKAIRALDRADAKAIPILAMTANAFTENISLAISAGMNGHIAKPIDNKILYQKLNEIFRKQK